MKEKILLSENKVLRHNISVRLVHWLIALSTLVLLFSGFGQMPMYRRYMIDQLPGLAWSSDYSITLVMHYAAAFILIFAAFYHLVYTLLAKDFDIFPRRGDFKESLLIIKAMFGFGKEPENDKFLAEQRLAYAYIVSTLVLIIITGGVKVIKNLPGIWLPDNIIKLATFLHNLGTGLIIFGIIAHLAAFLLKDNRSLVVSIFTGKVDLDYVKRRHFRWYERLISQTVGGNEGAQAKPTEHASPLRNQSCCERSQ
ncbi:MAG: formate dehydrogenase subunit gamma [Bacillota bacterium]